MSDIYLALCKAITAINDGEKAELMIEIAACSTGMALTSKVTALEAVAHLWGIQTQRASSTSATPTPARGKAKSPIFIREVLEFDPAVFNGYSISRGAFINNLATYTGSNLLCVGTRGTGDKLLMFGTKSHGTNYPFTYPSGSSGTLHDFICEFSSNSWKDAHAFLDGKGIPHGTAKPFGKPVATT